MEYLRLRTNPETKIAPSASPWSTSPMHMTHRMGSNGKNGAGPIRRNATKFMMVPVRVRSLG